MRSRRTTCSRPAGKGGFEQDVALVTLPLFHSTAQTCQMNSGLLRRLPPGAAAALRSCGGAQDDRREKVGFWIGVPTMYWALLEYAASGRCDVRRSRQHLRVCVSGGAPMPVEVLRRFEETFGVRILEGYGLSETVAGRRVQPVADGQSSPAPSACRFLVWTSVRGRRRAAGRRGRARRSRRSRAERDEGLLQPARGHRRGHAERLVPHRRHRRPRQDGYLSIVDRKKDMILRGGFNVYPRELEILLTHPAVAWPPSSACPTRVGEEVKAFIVRKPGADVAEEMLVEWAREQFAWSQNIPASWSSETRCQ